MRILLKGDTMLKVFLVEDEFVVREGIKNNIDWSGHGYDFCGEAGDGEVAYSMIQKLKPDIVITDIKMPFMDGITLSRMIKSEFPWIEIIILTGYEDFQFAREAIKIGVSCYLLKPVNGESIMKEVDALSERSARKRRNGKQRSAMKKRCVSVRNSISGIISIRSLRAGKALPNSLRRRRICRSISPRYGITSCS